MLTYIKSILLIIPAMLLLTGCNFVSPVKTPEMLLERPVYNKERMEIYQKIESLIPPSCTLILPSNSLDAGKINSVDLNGDGNEDLVALYNNDRIGRPNQVGFMVYDFDSKNDKVKETYRYAFVGNSIEYINFFDIDGDGTKYVLLLSRNGVNYELSLFGKSHIDGRFGKISSLVIKNSDVKIKAGFLDDNRDLEILMVSTGETYNVNVDLIGVKNDELKVLNTLKYKDIKNVRDMNITIGNISKYISAFIVDFPLQSSNSVRTQVFKVENEKLEKVFPDDCKYLLKTSYTRPEDMNGDKIIDFPNRDSSITYQLSDTGDRYQATIINWYNYDPQATADCMMRLVNQVYYNYAYNFKFNIPNYLKNRLYIKQRQERDTAYFDIFYLDKEDAIGKKLYTIEIKSKDKKDESTVSDSYSIKENKDYVYGLIVQNQEMNEKLGLAHEEFDKCFELIYQ